MSDETMNEQELQFEKLRREIAVATREQGDDPEGNRRLHAALIRAEGLNMPDEMAEQARKLGAGEADGPEYEEKLYEGYGDAGIAVLVRTITSTPSRTHTELEHLFDEFGGNLGDEGCVAWQFERRGQLEVSEEHVDDPDQFLMEVIEWGGEELDEPVSGGALRDTDSYRIFCAPNDLNDLYESLSEHYPVASSSMVYQPTQELPVEQEVALRFVRFMERLLAHEDVQHVSSNWTFA